MALQIIYPAYQPMDFSPLFGDMTCSIRPVMRKRRRMMNADFIDKVFNDMFLPSYDTCAKRNTQSTKQSSSAETSPDTFTKKLNLKSFKPEDIQIRVTTDKQVIVEAKHEVREEKDGFQSYQLREFKKSLDVPENVNIEELTSSFNEQGDLTISAPLLALPEPKKTEEINLPVTFDKENNKKKNDDSSSKPDSNSNDDAAPKTTEVGEST